MHATCCTQVYFKRYQSCTWRASSYHFLHKTVQEFLAAFHVSSLPPGERDEFVRTSFGERTITMIVRFVAGLTKLQSNDNIESILEYQKRGKHQLVESLHWLFEAHDPDLVHRCMGDREWNLELSNEGLDPFDFYVLGYCLANSKQLWNLDLEDCSTNSECLKMLAMVENGKAFDYIKSIGIGFDDEDKHVQWQIEGNQGITIPGLLYCTCGRRGDVFLLTTHKGDYSSIYIVPTSSPGSGSSVT